jgi:hypothetical protein
MKDRNAFIENKKFNRGVSADETKTLKAWGVPKQGIGTVPAGPRTTGVTMGELGYLPVLTPPLPKRAPKKPVCHGQNKEGKDCGAYPVKGEEYCVGHLRGQGRHSE